MDTTALPVNPTMGRVCVGARYHSPKVHRVQKHHIWPKGWGGPSIEAEDAWHEVWEWLCGSCHDSVHELLDVYRAAGGAPPWTVRMRFPRRLRELAAEGWRRDTQAAA